MPNAVTTRDRILDAAKQLFPMLSYRGTSMQLLAKRVKISKATMYHHFPSKGSIVKELVLEPLAALERVVNRAELFEPLQARQEHLLVGFVDVMLEHREIVVVLLRDASVRTSFDTTREVSLIELFYDVLDRAVTVLSDGSLGWLPRLRAMQALAALAAPLPRLPQVSSEELRPVLLNGARAALLVDFY